MTVGIAGEVNFVAGLPERPKEFVDLIAVKGRTFHDNVPNKTRIDKPRRSTNDPWLVFLHVEFEKVYDGSFLEPTHLLRKNVQSRHGHLYLSLVFFQSIFLETRLAGIVANRQRKIPGLVAYVVRKRGDATAAVIVAF